MYVDEVRYTKNFDLLLKHSDVSHTEANICQLIRDILIREILLSSFNLPESAFTAVLTIP